MLMSFNYYVAVGFQIQIGPKSFIGSHVLAIKEEVSRKVEFCVRMLKRSAIECEGKGVIYALLLVITALLKNIRDFKKNFMIKSFLKVKDNMLF